MTTIITDPKIESVQRLYAGYASRDMGAVLAELADDVDWAAEAAGHAAPWHGAYRGKADVPRFFEAIGAALDISEFAIIGYCSNDTDVIATVHWTFTARSTGKTAAMYMQHWFRFDEGKIVFFRGSEDSAQSAAALA